MTCAVAALIPCAHVSADATIRPEGKISPYSERLASYFSRKKNSGFHPSASFRARALETRNDPLYIGLEQSFTVNAPASKVVAVIEDFGNYPNLFDEVVKAEVTKRSGADRFVLLQEQKIPLPFIPNTKFEMSYCTVSPSAKEKYYIYRVSSGKDLKYDDGMIMIKQLSDTSCAVYELDFIYGNWGALGPIPDSIIWESVVKGMVQANMIIKCRAENPQWGYGACKSEAKKLCSGINVADIVKKKISADAVL